MMELYNWVSHFLFHFLLIKFYFITNFMTVISFFLPFSFNFYSYLIWPFGEQSPSAERINTLSHNDFKILLQNTASWNLFFFLLLHFSPRQRPVTHVKHKGNTTLLTVLERWLITSREPWQNHIFVADAAFKFGQSCQRDSS